MPNSGVVESVKDGVRQAVDGLSDEDVKNSVTVSQE